MSQGEARKPKNLGDEGRNSCVPTSQEIALRQVKGLITERALGMDVTYTAVGAEVDAPLQRDATLGLDVASTMWTSTGFGVGSDMMWDVIADAGTSFNVTSRATAP